MKSLARFTAFLTLVSLLAVAVGAKPEKWTGEIDRLTANDATHPPAPGGVVFVGSSSFRLWTSLATDFPQRPVIQRGFGGSELADSVFYLDRVVLPYRPAIVVLYAGENDLWGGRSPEGVAGDFRDFRTRLHAALPATQLIYLSVKPSPARDRMRAVFQRANELIAADCATDPRCRFLDVATAMLDSAGQLRPELYQPDQLHLRPAGYAIWTRLLTPLLQP